MNRSFHGNARPIPKTSKRRRWSIEEEQLLGTKPDRLLAKKLGRTISAVIARRHHRHISLIKSWRPEDDKLLGTRPDAQVALLLKRSRYQVAYRRRQLGIAFKHPDYHLWKSVEIAMLGTNAVIATPSVSFAYDTNYNRLLTMTDGTGVTTYNYYSVASGQLGAGQMASVSNSFIGPTSLICYNYDALGRITNRAINGISQQITFDALHRVIQVTNVLGSFTNTYLGGTTLLTTNFYPNGQKTVFSYLSVANDERLSEIWNQNTSGTTLSKFDYGYDPLGQITNWTQQADAATPTVYTYQYDAGNQIISAVLNSTGAGASVLKQYAYGYDLAGNRTGEQVGTGTNGPVALSQSSYNNVNQFTNRVGGSGQMLFAGGVTKPAAVTVGGNAAMVNHATTNFAGYASVTLGTNVVPVIAQDYSGNAATNKYQLVVTNNGVAKTISYDLNGNETSVVTATSTNTYQWDAANRMASITGPTNQSLFTYDGYGRRVQIIELTNGVPYVTNKYVWDGQTLAEQRDLTGATVTKRFFGEGEQVSGTNYLFTRDHLGSVREVINTAGAIQARYDYDPYGRPTVIAGTFAADFGYAGMYYHASSGLNLTLYRAYDPDLGRWPNRDPMEEKVGLNLYAYAKNNPINLIDILGLDSQTTVGIGGTLGGFGFGVTGSFNFGITSSGQPIIQFQAAVMNGRGLFAGVGFQGGVSNGPNPTEPVSSETTAHFEADGGDVIAISGSGDFGADSQAVGFPIPGADRLGVGEGAWAGGGPSTTTTIAFPSIDKPGNNGVGNFLLWALTPLGHDCPAGSGNSDIWNYIAQLDMIEGLP